MLRSVSVVLVVIGVATAAQSPAPPPMSRLDVRPGGNAIETPHVTVTASTGSTAVAPGAQVPLFIDIVPKPTMHVYAPQQKSYIPVSITLEADRAFRAHPPVFPKPEKYFFAPLKETQLVYSKPFRIVQHVTLASASVLRGGGNVTVEGSLRYQACDDAICYFPKTLPISWRIELKRSAMQ